MAFPTVQTADTKNGVVTTNSTTWTLTYPTNLASGDLIIAVLAIDGSGNIGTWPSGWLAGGGGTNVCLLWAKKKSDGTETGTFNITSLNSEQGAWRVFRITGWEGTLGTILENDTASGSVVQTNTLFQSDANPNPPALNPNNWDTEDTLWMAVCAVDTSRTISVYPLTDLNTADVSGGANGATLGVCMANSAVSSLDPGTFTISASDDWGSATIAIRPVASVVLSTLTMLPMQPPLKTRF